MQKENESWDSSSCHSFCSTNARHFRDIDFDDEKLDFEADHPETVPPSKEDPPCTNDALEEGEVLADASADVEEGEIKDSSSVESCDDAQRCRFFEKGRCAFGEKCRFLHQSDKGLYTMFDRPRLPPRGFCSRLKIPWQLKTDIAFPFVSSEEDAADWDRELREAKLRVGFSRKKVPFDEPNLTVRTTGVVGSRFSTSPILDKDASVRKVRYRGEEESKPSKSNNTGRRETARALPPDASRYGKRRFSDTSRSRSRSVGRPFSCKCCRTPSPKQGRYRATRRPICCYRRKSVSSSSSSSSLASRGRAATRRVRDVVDDTRRKRPGKSQTTSPDRTKSHQCVASSIASSERGLGRKYQTSSKRRSSKDLSPSFPKAVKSLSSSLKSISSTSHSPAKVDRHASSYSPDRLLSDMSISPYSSDSFSDSENESDNLSSSIRRPSDMSISPFSDSSSPNRLPISVGKADQPSNGVAAQISKRKLAKSDSSFLEKRVKSDIAGRNPGLILPQIPSCGNSPTKNKVRRDVQETKTFASSREVLNSISTSHKKRLKSNVSESKPPAEPREILKSERSTPNTVFENDFSKPTTLLQTVPKSVIYNPKEKLKNKDIAERKSPASSQEVSKSDNFSSKKQYNHLLFDLMKFHRKGNSTKVTTEAAHTVERKETQVTKFQQKSAATHRIATLSKKELLLKQLQEVNAAIERKKLQMKQKH